MKTRFEAGSREIPGIQVLDPLVSVSWSVQHCSAYNQKNAGDSGGSSLLLNPVSTSPTMSTRNASCVMQDRLGGPVGPLG